MNLTALLTFTLTILATVISASILSSVRKFRGLRRAGVIVGGAVIGLIISFLIPNQSGSQTVPSATRETGGNNEPVSPAKTPPTQDTSPVPSTARPKQTQPITKGQTETAGAKKSQEKAEPATTITGPATTNGPNSVANTGTIGTINLNTPPKEETKQ